MYLILLLFSISSFAAQDLALHPKWIKLLHYKKTLSGWESEADGKDFFLSEKGKYNPQIELQKAMEVFSSETRPNDDHPICKFPLRYKWLKNEIGKDWKIDFSGCQKYISFLSKVAARRASIVFSSYYLSNPNSAFGHTFLRFSRYEDKNETEMLDYGINYSAQARETNPVLYAWKGLFGGFKGNFAAIPYYYKVREYSDFEFRDLWSYDLKLNQYQVLEMLDHIWELGNTYFDYYYFKENCSYHLLSVLEVALPERKLTDRYSVFAIPADTIRLLKEEELIEEGKKRESTFSRLTRMSSALNADSLGIAKNIALNPNKSEGLIAKMDDKTGAEILDVSIEAFDYYNSEKLLSDEIKTKELKAPLLSARARNPVISEDRPQTNILKDSPAGSHSPTRFSLSQGYQHKEGSETRFQFRAAHHDLLDPIPGALENAQLEIGKVTLNLKQNDYRKSRPLLEDTIFFSLKNYPAQNFWASPISWEIESGINQLRRLDCFDCPAAFATGSIGNSLHLFSNRLLVALLMNTQLDLHNYYQDSYRIGLGPKLVGRFIFTDWWLMGLETYYHYNTFAGDSIFVRNDLIYKLESRFHIHNRFSVFTKLGGQEKLKQTRNSLELGLQYFYE